MFGWFGGGSIKLKIFVQANPPHAGDTPVPADWAARFNGRLPAPLIELWRKHGLGIYGASALRLVDPEAWQPILDHWLPSPTGGAIRLPIALTPFGAIIHYAKDASQGEDIGMFDPVRRKDRSLAKDLVEFFNGYLTNRQKRDALVSTYWLEAARKNCGELGENEVYQVDQALLTLRTLKFTKHDAMTLHRELRDVVDDAAPAVPPDGSEDVEGKV